MANEFDNYILYEPDYSGVDSRLQDLRSVTRKSLSAPVDTRTFAQYDPSMADAQRQIGSSVAGAAMPDNPYRSEALETIRRNVAQAMTDPMMGTFVPAKGMEAGAFTDLLSRKTMREIADNGMKWRGKDFRDAVEKAAERNTGNNLSDYVSHKTLEQEAPQVFKYPVETTPDYNMASFDKKYGYGFPYDGNKKFMVGHEMQHAVQDNANWPGGANPGNIPKSIINKMVKRLEKATGPLVPGEMDMIKQAAYELHWGEEQARRTANRMEMTAEERLGRPYGEKLIERPDGTFTYGGKGATDVPNLEDLILRYR